ncbi:MAG TPA: hypothetical protein VKE40_04615, partial [Gemmataceae bacterium]|nr:hypothetical protein [Gemmataceae bacterium]
RHAPVLRLDEGLEHFAAAGLGERVGGVRHGMVLGGGRVEGCVGTANGTRVIAAPRTGVD